MEVNLIMLLISCNQWDTYVFLYSFLIRGISLAVSALLLTCNTVGSLLLNYWSYSMCILSCLSFVPLVDGLTDYCCLPWNTEAWSKYKLYLAACKYVPVI